MADYFTSEHFKLLNKWQGQKRDDSNPEQNRAYAELARAYEIVEAWAHALQARVFPNGRVDLRKAPTPNARFSPFLWARIYPYTDAPKELAYTLNIDAKNGFELAIDTVSLKDSDPRRKSYKALRGTDDNNSPLVAVLPAAGGLNWNMAQLVDWSAAAIKGFKLRYDEVAAKLNLVRSLSDEDLLTHFDGKPVFKTFRAGWSEQDKARFCRLARAVHAAGLDWWHVGKGIQVRFGRKNLGTERAIGVLGIIRGTRNRTITWTHALGAVSKLNRVPLTDDLLVKMEGALADGGDMLDEWLGREAERPGLWPDQLREDMDEPDQDDEGSEDSTESAAPIQGKLRPALNRIYYGPPGTGKTYELTKLLRTDYEQEIASVSIDEWRAQLIAEKIATLTWWEAIAAALHDLGGKAKVAQIYAHPFIQAIALAKNRNSNVKATIWGTLQHHTVEESLTVNIKIRMTPAVFDKSTDSYWHLAGDWSEACADILEFVRAYQAGPPKQGSIKHYSFVTFHQSYGYEEFVEGLRPVLDVEDEAGAVRYEIRSGVFKELCRNARLAPTQRFAMVIDEINRGNISKIFGELITLIEPDKREGAEHALTVVLPYSGESFSVPSNVDIIGTMNTADRSLALLDTALRRRFEFVPLLPDVRDVGDAPLAGLRVTMNEQPINVPCMLEAMNQRIEALYDRDHCIGHAYFIKLKDAKDEGAKFTALSDIFKKCILPLLEEYFFEDWQKIRLVLADNQKSKEAQFVFESQDQDTELARLFGKQHGLDSFNTKRRYMLNEDAFKNPKAYIGIYDTLPAS